MKIVSAQKLSYIPASHEETADPGVLKKILFTDKDLTLGKIKMINWAKLPKGRSFRPHYHEDMEEIFIILSGQASIRISDERAILKSGDSVLIPIKAIHEMKNVGSEDVYYIVIGISLDKGGKTVNV
jgi:mannose-6-phosphate isomerase-like protein (cupin superfamily)